jgi:putative membrane protein
MHTHGAAPSLDAVVLALAAGAVAVYVVGVRVSAKRGRPWPAYRVALWAGGIALATVAVIGPLADAAHDSFVAHMWAHLFGGMLAPLLLVLAAPVTLAFRSLDVTPARRLSRLLRSAPAQLIAHPVTAAILSAGGLWAIYLSPLYESMRATSLMHMVVHAHLLLAGYLFTAAIIGLDPAPHRPRRILVAVVLVLTLASHAILAKYLYAHPPAGVTPLEARQGAELMYYAGSWIEAAVIVVFCTHWYRATGRGLAAAQIPATPVRR